MMIAATLPASDMERAKAWYASVLQLQPKEITEDGSAWYQLGETSFIVYPSEYAGTNKATAAAIGVDDVEATVAELKSRGAVFEEYDFGDDVRTVDGILTSPSGRKMAWCKDSEGNILGLATP